MRMRYWAGGGVFTAAPTGCDYCKYGGRSSVFRYASTQSQNHMTYFLFYYIKARKVSLHNQEDRRLHLKRYVMD